MTTLKFLVVFTAFAALAAAQADLPHDAESEFALEHLLDGANLLETNLNEPHDLTDADAQLILDLATTSKTRGKQRGVLSPTCADAGTDASWWPTEDGYCPSWVANNCAQDWAKTACALTCNECELCTLGEWGAWGECSSVTDHGLKCGGGNRYRTRAAGNCGEDNSYDETEQCNTIDCVPEAACSLSPSDPIVITEDNAVVENLSITTTGVAPAIFVYNASNVVLRNIKIVHGGAVRVKGTDTDLKLFVDQSGAGIFFQDSPHITIENVHVSLVRPSPNPSATDGICAEQYCGPFPFDMKYAYNIYGLDSEAPTLSNVYVTGGSTGFWCQDCPYGKVSHYKAENLHGPYPRGQCFQVVSCAGFTLSDFTCMQDNELAFPEDDISIWNSSYGVIQRGFVQGGNAPHGVGVISEMSDHVVVQDVDITLVGGTSFSAYGAHNVTFLRTRAKNNHGDGGCKDAHGYCKDGDGAWPNSEFYEGDQTVPDKTCACDSDSNKRCDTDGGVWYAGDYTADQAGGAYTHKASSIQIKQGVFFNMTRLESTESYSSEGTCVEIDDSDWATSAANRQEAYTLKDFAMEDFTLRTPFNPTFCFSTETPQLLTASPTTASPTTSCSDVGSDSIALVDGKCPAWVVGYCTKAWANLACPASCDACPDF